MLDKILGFIASLPHIVESGTTNNWYYRKWSDGTAECWRRYGVSVAANTVRTSDILQFPFTFTEVPTVLMSIAAGGADLYRGHIESSSTNASQVRLVFINKHTAAVPMVAQLQAIGKWK